jgi:hypothetical protein
VIAPGSRFLGRRAAGSGLRNIAVSLRCNKVYSGIKALYGRIRNLAEPRDWQ